MRLRNFLDDILGGRNKVKLLRILTAYPTKEFTERELGRTAKIPYQSVNYVVKDFVRDNFLTIRRVGASNLYSTNRDSYLFPILKDLFGAESKMFHEVASIIGKTVKSAREIQLFGSVARGTEEPGSDIDVFIITADTKRTQEEVAVLNQELAKRFGMVVSPIIKTREEWKRTSKKLLESIDADSFRIKGRADRR